MLTKHKHILCLLSCHTKNYEWLMIFAKVALYSMVFRWFSNMWTIGVNGFSMSFYLWIIDVNGFSMVFFWSVPLLSMVFPMFFYNQTIAIALMVCDSPFASMVYQWFWGKWALVHKKGQNAKKTWFVEKKHRGKQTLDRLTKGKVWKKKHKKN